MPARTAREAVAEFADGFSRLVGCVTDRPLLATGHSVGIPHYVSFLPLRQAAPLRFRGISGPVAFDLRIDYIVSVSSAAPRQFDVEVIGYSYRWLERSGRELLAFHWHPVGLSRIVTPHLHLSSRLRPIPLEPVGLTISLADHHIPTGNVTLVDFVRYLISEVGIEPRRSDWREVLASASD